LGLAICRRIIIERHNGKIQIDSEEKKGTTIKIELPISRQRGDR
jgi:signal transduction histidine kinase